jgi:pectate lyase
MTVRMTVACVALVLVACDGKQQDREVETYDAVENRSDANARVDGTDSQMGEGELNVVCDHGTTVGVETTVVDGVLIIDGAGETNCEVNVPARYVNRFTVTGNGELRSEGPWDGVAFIDIQGSGDVDLDQVTASDLEIYSTGNAKLKIADLSANALMVDLRGTSDATLAGSGGEATFMATGDAVLDAQDYEVENLTLDVSGNATVKAYAWGTVDGTITGASNVDLWGGGIVDVSLIADLIVHAD